MSEENATENLTESHAETTTHSAETEGERGTLLGTKPEEPPAEPEPFDIEKLTVPEGLSLGDDDRAFLTEVAEKHGLSLGAANALLPRVASLMQAQAEEMTRAFNETVDGWANEVRQHYGNRLDSTLGQIGKVLDEFGSKELREAFTLTGIGNHPELVKFLDKVAGALGEAKPVNPAGEPGQSADLLTRVYPSMAKKG